MNTSPGTVAKWYELNEQTIGQLLADPEFYTSCVAFSYLFRKGTAASKQLTAVIAHRGDPKLPSESAARWELGLVVASFVKHVALLHDLDVTLLKPLRDYLETCLGYCPEKVVLRYKEHGELLELIF